MGEKTHLLDLSRCNRLKIHCGVLDDPAPSVTGDTVILNTEREVDDDLTESDLSEDSYMELWSNESFSTSSISVTSLFGDDSEDLPVYNEGVRQNIIR